MDGLAENFSLVCLFTGKPGLPGGGILSQLEAYSYKKKSEIIFSHALIFCTSPNNQDTEICVLFFFLLVF